MSKGSSAPDPIPESEESKQMGRIVDEQYGLVKSIYDPFKQTMIASTQESPIAQIERANRAFSNSANMNTGMMNRSMARVGVDSPLRQLESQSRIGALNLAAATGKGVTDYARNITDQNAALRGALVASGKQAVGQASEGLGTANSNYMAQQQQHQQAVMAQKQANQAATNQTITTLGAVGMMALSDERLKDNVAEIDSALDKVEKLSGVTWEWRPEAEAFGLESVSAGVIAQDVEAVLPEAAATGDTGYKQVNYSALVGLLVNAVKELSAEVKALKETK